MSKYDIQNYSSFDNGISTTSNLMNSLENASKILDTCKNNLSNNSIFMGPLCDECVTAFGDASAKIKNLSTQYNKVKNTLATDSSEYSNSDKNESKKITDVNTSSVSNTKASQVTNKAIDWAKSIADDDSIGYVNGGMGKDVNGGYDCTQFVHAAYEAAGLDMTDKENHNQTTIREFYEPKGFTWHDGPINPDELQPGDVLVNQDHHAEMYIGNGQKIGAHNDWDDSYGDSSGTEISINDYSEYGNGGWDGYLRYEGDNNNS